MTPYDMRVTDQLFTCEHCPPDANQHTAATMAKDSSVALGHRHSICRNCWNARQRARRARILEAGGREARKYRTKERQAQRKIRSKRRTQTKRAKAQLQRDRDAMSQVLVPVAAIRPWVERLIEVHGSQAAVSELSGVDDRRLYEILGGVNSRGKLVSNVELATADALAIIADRQLELAALVPLEGKDGWSRVGHRYCTGCGTWRFPHYAKGMCKECYDIDYNERPVLHRDERTGWCVYVNECRDCGTNEREHVARGLCGACYNRNRVGGTLHKFPPFTKQTHRRKAV